MKITYSKDIGASTIFYNIEKNEINSRGGGLGKPP